MRLSEIMQNKSSDIYTIDKNTLSNINILINNSDLNLNKNTTSLLNQTILNTPIQTCDVHPLYWEDDFMKIIGKIKYISSSPTPYISSMDHILLLKNISFNTIEDILSFLDKEVGEPVLYTIRKSLDITNIHLGYKYDIRIGFIKDKSDIRAQKIGELIN
jgi:hypothetical protein